MSQETDARMVAELVALELDAIAGKMLANVARDGMTRERRAYALLDDALFGLAYLVGVLQSASPDMHERLQAGLHQINEAWYRAFLTRDPSPSAIRVLSGEPRREVVEVGG